MHNELFIAIFLIFTGSAILATAALFLRQVLIMAYLALGVIIGPYALGWLNDFSVIQEISDIGIIFLLFLLGLNLHPQNLLLTLYNANLITILSSGTFALVGFVLGKVFGFNNTEALLLAMSTMFSSTIIGLKLLPTTVLHHQKLGKWVISVLLLQDLIAIFLLLMLKAAAQGVGTQIWHFINVVISLPIIIVGCFVAERYLLCPLLSKYDTLHEYVFLLAIGWCLGIAALTNYYLMSSEIGAFIAGIALASSPISFYIAESLKPIRDFFLILFFFSLGAKFNFWQLPDYAVVVVVSSVVMLVLKPLMFSVLFKMRGLTKPLANEMAVRLGQMSEFSLLLIYVAQMAQLASERITFVIQAVTLITFVVSTYLIILQYPTPISTNAKLRQL